MQGCLRVLPQNPGKITQLSGDGRTKIMSGKLTTPVATHAIGNYQQCTIGNCFAGMVVFVFLPITTVGSVGYH
jgi:hypothetical protein